MSDSLNNPQPADDLQFDTAEVGRTSASPTARPECAVCHEPITSTYYALRDNWLCPRCRAMMAGPTSGSPLGRFVMACLFGMGAGLAGTVVWYIARIVTQHEIGIVAMLVGYMVGKAVRKGSGGWGGRGYQVLAVMITYACIAATYVPAIVEAVRQRAVQARQEKLAAQDDKAAGKAIEKPGPAGKEPGDAADAPVKPLRADRSPMSVVIALGTLLCLWLALPVVVGFQSPILLVIYGIGLWEAWKFAARPVLPIVGPLQLGSQPT